MDISKVPEHTIVNLIKAVIKHTTAWHGEDRTDMLIDLIQTIKEYSKDVEEYERKQYLSRRFARSDSD